MQTLITLKRIRFQTLLVAWLLEYPSCLACDGRRGNNYESHPKRILFNSMVGGLSLALGQEGQERKNTNSIENQSFSEFHGRRIITLVWF